jgi:hypothetical protein
MIVTSGYRSIELNRSLGSKDSSDHVRALAADWEAPAFGSPTVVCRALLPVVEELQIGQLIDEYPDRDGWIHTGVNLPSKALNRILTITRGGLSVGLTWGKR